jgi:hypothetical protein
LQALKLFPNNEAVLNKLEEIEKLLAPSKITTDEIEKVAKMPEGIPSETVQVPVPAGGRVPVVPPAPTPPPPRVEPKAAPPPPAPVQRPSASPAPAPAASRPYEAAEPKSFPVAMVLGGVGVLLLVAFLVIFFWPRGPQTNTSTTGPTTNPGTQPGGTTSTPPPVIPPVAVSIDALPWATIRISGGDLKNSITEITPAIVALPPGRYTVEFENPNLPKFTETLDVNESNHRFSFSFRQFDAGKIADSVFQ